MLLFFVFNHLTDWQEYWRNGIKWKNVCDERNRFRKMGVQMRRELPPGKMGVAQEKTFPK
jgi:hypothetical protein